MNHRIATRGMTLLEVVIVGAIVTVITAMLFPALRTASDTMNDGVLQAELDQKAAMICDEIAKNIRRAKNSTVTIPPGSVLYAESSSTFTSTGTATETYTGLQIVDTNTGTVTDTGTATATDITITTGSGGTITLNKGGTEVDFYQVLGYNTSSGYPTPGWNSTTDFYHTDTSTGTSTTKGTGLVLGANLDGSQDDTTASDNNYLISQSAQIAAQVIYKYEVLNGKNCLTAYSGGKFHHVLTDQLAPVYSYFQQTNKGVKIQILIMQENQRLKMQIPNLDPNNLDQRAQYTMYGIASTTIVPEVP